jgi:hypothetical protein
MAIDMIESCEIGGVFNGSRLGLNNFVDDNIGSPVNKKRVVATNEEWKNLFGSRKTKQAVRDKTNDTLKRYKEYYESSDCEKIRTGLGIIANEVETNAGRQATANKAKIGRAELDAALFVQGKIQGAYIKAGCQKADDIIKRSEDKVAERENIAAATQAGNALIEKTKEVLGITPSAGQAVDPVTGKPVPGKNKTMLYAGIGVGVLVVGFLIYKMVKK